MRVGLLRAVGAATAVHGTAVAVWPDLLARPSSLVDERGRPARDTRVALRPPAWRDAASGLAPASAPRGRALLTAALVRIKGLQAVAVSLGRGALSVAGLLGRGEERGEHGERGDRGRG